MPQPVNLRSWSYPQQCLTYRPAAAVLIATIASEWTVIEEALAGIVGNAFGRTSRVDEPFDFGTFNFPMSLAISSVDTIRSRLSIIGNTLGRLVANTSLCDEWAQLEKTLRARSRERNRVVHGRWRIADEFPEDLIEARSEGSVMLYRWTVRDLQELADRVTDAWKQCGKFRENFVTAMNGADNTLRINHSNLLSYPYEPFENLDD